MSNIQNEIAMEERARRENIMYGLMGDLKIRDDLLEECLHVMFSTNVLKKENLKDKIEKLLKENE